MFKVQPGGMNKNELLPGIICAQEALCESGGVVYDYLTDASFLAQ